ncbi:MAG: ABC transporter permease subunit [Eubacterium sp.]|nr:ABC transporter permease subunit [Eubacterium sp.]
MSKLLAANFSRMKKDVSFWIISAAVLMISISEVINNAYIDATVYPEDGKTILDFLLFQTIPAMGMVYAIFIAMFIGKEYSNGTIRNKLIVGHTRTNIYLANFITCLTGSLIIYSMIFIGDFGVGIPLLGGWKGKISELITYIIVGVCLSAALVSLLTVFSMLCTRRSVTAVTAMVFAFALMLTASIIYKRLAEPEMTQDLLALTIDGVPELSEPRPNPLYVSGNLRKIYEFLMQFLPTGQGILLAQQKITNPVLNIICSIIITVAANFCGLFVFRKKNLK